MIKYLNNQIKHLIIKWMIKYLNNQMNHSIIKEFNNEIDDFLGY